jgi:dTDP-4-amino-4,6-dideoxygalactose transaminase
MAEIIYNSWPLGKLPKEWQRTEPEKIKDLGYQWNDPREIVEIFEQKLATFAGSKYAVTIDCCTHGLYLALKYLKANDKITIPKRTYVSVPMQIIHAGCSVAFEDIEWSGIYQLKPYPIYDGATRFTKNMYMGGDALQVISFQIKKRLPIGRGGAIFTDSLDAYKWLKLASYDGRDLNTYYMDPNHVLQLGWHYYMTPEDAARGIILMDQLPEENPDTGGSSNYFDLSCHPLFKGGV